MATGYQLVRQKTGKTIPYPLVRSLNGQETIWCISPNHGRSFILRHESDAEWTVGKGNGLSYTTHPFLLTSKIQGDTWGGLPLANAIRDYDIGCEVNALGIKTNRMECVVALDKTILQNGASCQAALLQYSVECPYRISDYGFIPQDILRQCLRKWEHPHGLYHLYAAEVIVRNLRTLKDHHIMHNAMHAQNYTWALELLDFEASRSDLTPYDNPDYESFIPMLSEAEAVQAYEIINYIAWCLGETTDYNGIEYVFTKYGFEFQPII